ncbi:mas-related G-protein coupled receptor member G [Dasypus novemcinctus]|uniref:mas-related G-protein coupled receptor member G n=1 Tax=Dasypus novemcinctus TaxID=9361 RepID=UPI00265E6B9E|nr:mas-related G-protein coupled receptor member G [Dasypus novemcinctus]
MFRLWRAFADAVFYATLVLGLGGLLGNALVLWHLGLHIQRGPFSVYALHLAAADFLFLACLVGFSAARAALGALDFPSDTVTFLCFAAGLWLLAALSTERCLSHLLPACYPRCRPRHTSAAACALIWALSLPAVLLPADACGHLRRRARPLACVSYHAAQVAWLACLAAAACVSGLALFCWVACCSRRARPHFYGVVLGAVLLLALGGLPFALHWSLGGLLRALLPALGPVARLLACVHAGAKPLVYFAVGRQRGRREPLRAVLQRALGDKPEPGAPGPSLPLRLM